MHTKRFTKLSAALQPGQVYRREMLLQFSKAIDRDLIALVNNGLLVKVAVGLYYKPSNSRFGSLPPDDEKLIKAFLRDDSFLLYSWNQYNTLGLGLTQLYNKTIVYNCKRHGVFTLNNKEYDFRRPARGYPSKLSPEFLLVDLVNNISELAEDADIVKSNIKKSFHKFNVAKIAKYAKQYGKIATHRFFKEIMNEH